MKYRHQRGLVCAGGVSRSFLAGLPTLLSTFGPVVASSLRVARRMSNLLKAGKPAADSSAAVGVNARDDSSPQTFASLTALAPLSSPALP